MKYQILFYSIHLEHSSSYIHILFDHDVSSFILSYLKIKSFSTALCSDGVVPHSSFLDFQIKFYERANQLDRERRKHLILGFVFLRSPTYINPVSESWLGEEIFDTALRFCWREPLDLFSHLTSTY